MKKTKKGNFWQKIHKPFFVLAPMANVTDSVFRRMIAKYGKPDVMWTEFVSADGLVSAGQKKLLVDLVYSEQERPIVAQLFTGHPKMMREAGKIVERLGFDGLDINMGCPDRAVEKQGGGASLIKNPKLALEVLKSARNGAPNIPVSVKTRIGYNKIDLEWIQFLLEQKIPVLTVHLRTRKEMSDVPAHWEVMPEIVKMRDQICPETLIIGNGDVASLADGMDKIQASGCDGVMIGRGIFGKPWFFGSVSPEAIPARLKIMLEHAKLFDKTFNGIKNFAVMKKHFKAYVHGWDGAKDLRVKLMETENFKDVNRVVKAYLKTL